MSLYCFGKLLPPIDIGELLAGFDCRVRELGVEDREDLDQEPGLKGEGEYFVICDPEGPDTATGLWNDAFYAKEASELERIVREIIGATGVRVGAIAFVDGGIERVIEGSREECLERIRALLREPWDTIGNPLFVWSS